MRFVWSSGSSLSNQESCRKNNNGWCTSLSSRVSPPSRYSNANITTLHADSNSNYPFQGTHVWYEVLCWQQPPPPPPPRRLQSYLKRLRRACTTVVEYTNSTMLQSSRTARYRCGWGWRPLPERPRLLRVILLLGVVLTLFLRSLCIQKLKGHILQ